MADHQDIVYNGTDAGGQVLYIDCPEGRPSSVVSCTVLGMSDDDDGTAESATTGSPAVETSPNTTFDGNAGNAQSNSRLMPIAATTGVDVDRTFLITDAQGRQEWPEIVAVSSGVSATARNPLQNDYVSGDSFVSTRIEQSLLGSWCATESKLSDDTSPFPGYRVRWIYKINSDATTIVRYTTFDLVRVAAGDHNLRPADVERLRPGFIDSLGTWDRVDVARGLIDEASQELRLMLAAVDIPDEMTRDPHTMDRLTAHLTILMFEESRALNGGGDEARVELAQKRFDRLWLTLVRGPTQPKIPVATDTSGAGGAVTSIGITRR